VGWTRRSHLGQTWSGRVGATDDPTNLFFFMLGWTRLDHQGWAKMGPSQGPHGHSPSQATMLIKFVIVCRLNFACNSYKGG